MLFEDETVKVKGWPQREISGIAGCHDSDGEAAQSGTAPDASLVFVRIVAGNE
jgi:hypothetical protein